MSTPRTADPGTISQMTLSEFIAALEHAPQDHPVRFDFGTAPKGETQLFDCYYEHPAELAISHRNPSPDPRMTSAETVMYRAHSALGCTFMDRDQNEHTAGPHTPLWAANWNTPTKNAVVGLEILPGCVLIRTWRMD